MGGFRKIGTPNKDPQVVGSPYRKDLNKVHLRTFGHPRIGLQVVLRAPENTFASQGSGGLIPGETGVLVIRV